ncbi:MAG: L-serine ammonia-lyase, iron-sulfur-dependent, subunit alpha [Phycisphaerales bacterium]|nr:L-serine ammonia-lyase, iron-sulfur-dependent, subunit alpha [Phycisphaerales bacterium]
MPHAPAPSAPAPPAAPNPPVRRAPSMESISVFDIFKIGVGPSSSHTMGPWRAAQRFTRHLHDAGLLKSTVRVRTDLYGSLAKTGKGHGTDLAVVLGLAGEDPVTCKVEGLHERVEAIKSSGLIHLRAEHQAQFDPDADLLFHFDQTLPFHPNGLRFTALLGDGRKVSETYYSVGGGFVTQEGETASGAAAVKLPYPCDTGEDVLRHCRENSLTIPRMVLANERAWRTDAQVRAGLLQIWRAMQECVYRGCHTGGTLPGGLNVVRRAKVMHDKLMAGRIVTGPGGDAVTGWINALRTTRADFQQTLRWVTTFALAVNEENAAFGRVVTAPTNGAAGVVPAVIMYAAAFCDLSQYKGALGSSEPEASVREAARGSASAAGPGRQAPSDSLAHASGSDKPGASSDAPLLDFMLTAGEIGSLFKKGATISAAMGGCQAEIGVSSAMAAAGLTQVLGGTPAQCLMAAEIAMEHHLGMTCDPIGGLVQIPCIERNTMGAIKAITAANMAIDGDPATAKVSFDQVVATMWQTSLDMQSKYKETSEGGLAVNVSVGLSEC